MGISRPVLTVNDAHSLLVLLLLVLLLLMLPMLPSPYHSFLQPEVINYCISNRSPGAVQKISYIVLVFLHRDHLLLLFSMLLLVYYSTAGG